MLTLSTLHCVCPEDLHFSDAMMSQGKSSESNRLRLMHLLLHRIPRSAKETHDLTSAAAWNTLDGVFSTGVGGRAER